VYKTKCKVAPVHAIKAYRRRTGLVPFYYLGTRWRNMLNFTPRPFPNLGKSSRQLQNTGCVGPKDGLYVLDRIKTSYLCRESNPEYSMPSPIHLTNCTSQLQICNIYYLHFIYNKFLLTSFALLLALCQWLVPHLSYPCCSSQHD